MLGYAHYSIGSRPRVWPTTRSRIHRLRASNRLPYSVSTVSDSGPLVMGCTSVLGTSGGGAGPSPAWVQGAITDAQLQTPPFSPSVAYGSSVTAGNLLVALAYFRMAAGSLTTISISDTIGNTWTPVWGSVQSPAGGGTNLRFLLGWYCLNTTTAADTVTATNNANQTVSGGLVLGEFSGFNGTATLDATVAISAAGSTTLLEGDFTSIHTNEAFFGFSTTNVAGVPTVSVGSDFTKASVGTAAFNVSAYSVQAVPGTYKMTGTWNSAGTTNTTAGFSIWNGVGT